MAKLRARDNWYKGRQEVDQPERESIEEGTNSSRRLECDQEQEEAPAEQARSPSRMEDCDNDEERSSSEQRPSRGLESEDTRTKVGKCKKVARKGKPRGPDRQTLTLGGIKKHKKALMRRSKRKSMKMCKAGIPAKMTSKEDTSQCNL